VRVEKTVEQQAVESALGNLVAVQPAQIEGNRASVLTQRLTGEYAVVSLLKQDGAWTTVSVLDGSGRNPQSGKSRRRQ
jgi:hypothetical protein